MVRESTPHRLARGPAAPYFPDTPHDRLAPGSPRHEPPAPDAAARHRGDDCRTLVRPPLRLGVRIPPGAGPVGPVPLAQGPDLRAGRRWRDPGEPNMVRWNRRAHDLPGTGVRGAGDRPQGAALQRRRLGIYHLAQPVRGGRPRANRTP